MIADCRGSPTPSTRLGPRLVAAGLLLLLASGCARPLVERAIAARGGPLPRVSREVEARVYRAFPGTWRWRIDYAVPDLLRWTLETYGDEQSYVYDGEALRYYLGSGLVTADPAAASGFRTQVRWIALTNLDVLASHAGLRLEELDAGRLPPGVAAGLHATYADGAVYELYFDAGDLLVGARGPIVVPAVGAGELRATFGGFRDVSGYLLPQRGRYTLDGEPLFDETILRWVPGDPRLTPEGFLGPLPRTQR